MVYQFENPRYVEKVEGKFRMGGKNPDGVEIYANNLYLTRDGKPFYPIAGEMPVTRTRRAHWEDRIIKMKADGVNTVSTYLFWCVHEFEEGKFDFTGDKDIRYFLEMCHKHDMMVSLRIGPWVTSEHLCGGLAPWIVQSGEYKWRTNDPKYLAKVKIWYEKVYEQVHPYLYKNGGNIIIMQIDNEMLDNAEHLQALKELAISVGLEAPIYTITGWGKNGGSLFHDYEFIPVWGGYPDAPFYTGTNKRRPAGHFEFTKNRNAPDIADQAIFNQEDFPPAHINYDEYPNCWAELGIGGNQAKHRRPWLKADDNFAMALTKLGGGMNMIGYYIFAGGRNMLINGNALNLWHGPWAKRCYPIISYEFTAAIRASGNLTPTYRRMKLINHFFNTYGAELCEMQTVLTDQKNDRYDLKHLRYAARLNKENEGYIFVNNFMHAYQKDGYTDVQFKMPDGNVVPEKGMNVPENYSFFIPYRIRYGSHLAEYATVEPLTKWGNTYFFVAIGDVEPIYKFEGMEPIAAKVGKENGFKLGEDTFITLTREEAERMCIFTDGIYLGDGCDLTETKQDGISAAGWDSYAYWHYEDGAWVYTQVAREPNLAEVTWEEIQDPGLDRKFFYELQSTGYEGESYEHFPDWPLKFYRLKVNGSNGYVHLRYSGDSAQLYCDGILSDDDFFMNGDWVVQAEMMDGKDCIVVISEYQHNIYIEVEPQSDHDLHEVVVTAE